MSYAAESGDIAFALTGDTLLTRRLAVHGEERYLRDLLRGADVAFTNFESTARSYDEGEAIPTEATSWGLRLEAALVDIGSLDGTCQKNMLMLCAMRTF